MINKGTYNFISTLYEYASTHIEPFFLDKGFYMIKINENLEELNYYIGLFENSIDIENSEYKDEYSYIDSLISIHNVLEVMVNSHYLDKDGINSAKRVIILIQKEYGKWLWEE